MRNWYKLALALVPSGELIYLSMLRTHKAGRQAILARAMGGNSEQTGYRGGNHETLWDPGKMDIRLRAELPA